MNEVDCKKWQDTFLYVGSEVNVDENYGVVFKILHIHVGKAWLTPHRITRLHEHHLIAGRCWCMIDQLTTMNRLNQAVLDL